MTMDKKANTITVQLYTDFPPRIGDTGVLWVKWSDMHMPCRERILIESYTIKYEDVLDWPTAVIRQVGTLLEAFNQYKEKENL